MVALSIVVIFCILISLVLIIKKDNAKSITLTQDTSEEKPDSSELIFYDLKGNPNHQQQDNQSTPEYVLAPCTTDMLCRIKNKNLKLPYDTIINDSIDSIDPETITEKDRLDAEKFSESLDIEPKSDQENEIIDMLDQLSVIQEDLDIHNQNAQEHQK